MPSKCLAQVAWQSTASDEAFAVRYFSVSSELSVEEWTTEEKAALDRCGHCDNCTRAPESVRRVDLRLPAWQILKAAEAVEHCGSHLTMRQLVDIVRGLGHGKISARRIRYKRAQESMTIDMTEIAGGKVELSPEVRTYKAAMLALPPELMVVGGP